MASAHILTLLLASTFVFQQQPAPKAPAQASKPSTKPTPAQGSLPPASQAKTGSPHRSALERLWGLIWPASEFNGDLVRTVTSITERSAPEMGTARLYVVNVTTHSYREWPGGAGILQATVCPDGKTLFYRRGARLLMQALSTDQTQVSPIGNPKQIEDVKVRWLYGCTQENDGGTALWAEDDGGVLHRLRLSPGRVSWADLPSDAALQPFEATTLAEDLQKLRSMRPDGFCAWIRDHKLIGKTNPESPPILLVESQISFWGYPNWVGQSPFLFVTGISSE
jgi:hypothetical protein